ncbi:hypothetical protein CcaverHIS002_0603410 [Cutaneotrichosporon cavernicola]|nr:hypothetical protein CcaverHIS002_0603410 [Cutaneotrichosporon cavernicola]
MPSAVNEKHRHHSHHHGHHNGHPSSHDRPLSLALVPASGSGPSPHRSSASALLSLSQDVTALVSLSIESAASLVNDYGRTALSTIGLVERSASRPIAAGSGLAVVVVGAADLSGQSLTLRLAKSGYTVFPFMPIAAAPSAGSSVSAPLSALLLAWSGVQKRLRTRDPNHTGAVVPVVIDDCGDAYLSAHTYPHSAFPPSPPKRGGRFAHAGDTVRHYCRENGLTLVAIVCASPSTSLAPCKNAPPCPTSLSPSQRPYPLIPGVTDSGLAHADEDAIIALYRAQVLEPIAVIRALGDMLAASRDTNRTRGRVLFVESTSVIDDSEPGHTARLLRTELGPAGIDVCEIAVGPMAPRLTVPLRSSSGDSDTDRALAAAADLGPKNVIAGDDVLTSRLRLLARIFAVDDALVYSTDIPRARHHAGLTPLISSIVNATPGAGVVRFLGRWVLGRLFSPRRQA